MLQMYNNRLPRFPRINNVYIYLIFLLSIFNSPYYGKVTGGLPENERYARYTLAAARPM
jgi:hypothetical protein